MVYSPFECNLHVAACLIKLFLRELPGALIPLQIAKNLIDLIRKIKSSFFWSDFFFLIQNLKNIVGKSKDQTASELTVESFQEVIYGLPLNNYYLAYELFHFLWLLQNNSQVNSMTASNLAISTAPSIFPQDVPIMDLMYCNDACAFMIVHCHELFPTNQPTDSQINEGILGDPSSNSFDSSDPMVEST